MISRNKFSPSNMDILLANREVNKRGLLSKISFDDDDYNQVSGISKEKNSLLKNKRIVVNLQKDILKALNNYGFITKNDGWGQIILQLNLDNGEFDEVDDYILDKLEKYLWAKYEKIYNSNIHPMLYIYKEYIQIRFYKQNLTYPSKINSLLNENISDYSTDYFDDIKYYYGAYHELMEIFEDFNNVILFIFDNIEDK